MNKPSLDCSVFIEAYGNYIKIHTESQMLVSHQTLSAFVTLLPEKEFIKVHKSFTVALNKIDFVEGNQLHIQTHTVPIGKMYKSSVNELLN